MKNGGGHAHRMTATAIGDALVAEHHLEITVSEFRTDQTLL